MALVGRRFEGSLRQASEDTVGMRGVPEAVDEVLRRALEDRDWQVRQNAEDLLHPRS